VKEITRILVAVALLAGGYYAYQLYRGLSMLNEARTKMYDTSFALQPYPDSTLADPLIKEFYDHQFNTPESLEEIAAARRPEFARCMAVNMVRYLYPKLPPEKRNVKGFLEADDKWFATIGGALFIVHGACEKAIE